MDPFSVKPVTAQDVAQAQQDKLDALATATGVVSAVVGFQYLFNAPGGQAGRFALKTGLTGISATPTETGRAKIGVPKTSLLAALLPSPVGYVPPEVYGLPPDLYIKDLGRPIGSKPLGFSPTETRQRVYAARVEADAIGAHILGTTPGEPSQFRATGFVPPPGPIHVTAAELDFLRSLPPGVSDAQLILPNLVGREGDLPVPVVVYQSPIYINTPRTGLYGLVNSSEILAASRTATPSNPITFYDALGNQVATVTGVVSMLELQQINDAGARNGRSKIGLQAELVHERADP